MFVSISIRFYARHYRSKFRNFSPTSTARTIILFTTYDRYIVHTSSPLPSTCYKMKIRKIGSESMTISNNSDVSTLKTRGAKLEQIRHARLIFGEDRGGHEMGRVPRVMTQEEDKYKDRSPKRFRAYATPCSSPGSRLPLRGL